MNIVLTRAPALHARFRASNLGISMRTGSGDLNGAHAHATRIVSTRTRYARIFGAGEGDFSR